MVDALTPEAPAEAPAVVVTPTSPPAQAVADSGSPEITKERFDGLMSAHQKALHELETERAARATLEASIPTTEGQSTVADEALYEKVNQLTAALEQERLESARRQALEDFPAAAPLGDLIIGSTPEQIRTMAQTIAERLTASAALEGEAIVTTEGEALAAPVTGEALAPVIPMSTGETFEGSAAAGDQVRAAIKSGDWDQYINAALQDPERRISD